MYVAHNIFFKFRNRYRVGDAGGVAVQGDGRVQEDGAGLSKGHSRAGGEEGGAAEGQVGARWLAKRLSSLPTGHHVAAPC